MFYLTSYRLLSASRRLSSGPPQLSCVPLRVHAYNMSRVPALGTPLRELDCAENPKHYSYMAVMSLIATTMLVQVSHLIKLALMVMVVTATGAVNIFSWRDIYDVYDFLGLAAHRWEKLNAAWHYG